MHPILLLMIAILTEVIGTAALKYSAGFTKLVPSLIVVVGYAISYYTFAVAIKNLNLGAAYAIWAGVGTAVTILISLQLLHEKMDLPLIIGVVLILLGVCIMSLYSKSITV